MSHEGQNDNQDNRDDNRNNGNNGNNRNNRNNGNNNRNDRNNNGRNNDDRDNRNNDDRDNNGRNNNGRNNGRNQIFAEDPDYTSDVSNGYVQSVDGNLFIGKSVDLCFSCKNKAYFVIHNPQDAETNMVVNTINIANLSDTPIRANLYTCAKIRVRGRLIESTNIAAANTDFCDTNPEGEIYYGSGIKILCAKNVSTAVVGEYSTHAIEAGGSIIVTPGNTVLLELCALSDYDKAKASVSLEWWEEEADN